MIGHHHTKPAIVLILISLVLLSVGSFVIWKQNNQKTSINSFAECVSAGNPVMESYPEQCAAHGKTFSNPDQKL
jgi:hypothetical protein